MSSLKTKFLKFFIKNTFNRDPVATLSKLESIRTKKEKKGNIRISEGLVLEKEETPAGTKYQRVYKKDGEKTGRVVYYLHGGAYISGLFSFYYKHAEMFINTFGCEVVFLDYKLAPEYKYPTQFNEALDLWNDLTNRQGYNAADIIVGGDSAGGNLTLSMMLKIRDMNMQMPRAGFCISPWADMLGKGKSYEENFLKDVMFGKKGRKLDENTKEEILNSDVYSFVGNADRKDPYVSPVYGDYYNFCPMFFTAGGDEMLLSDTYTIAEKLRDNGVFVDYDVQPEMFHIYTLLGKYTTESAISYRKLIKFIKRQFEV